MAPTSTENIRPDENMIQASETMDKPVKDQLPKGLEDRKLVGVKGNWYDVTEFLPLHPGGPVLEQYVGQDASDVFSTMFHKDVLKHRKPVGTYTIPRQHSSDEDFRRLHELFKKRGYYNTDFVWYAKKATVAMMMFASAFVGVLCFDQWYMHYLGAVCLAFTWQQCGFIMHDCMHGQVFKDGKYDKLGGLFFGTSIFGFSAHWWQDEHIIHHAMTNTVGAAHQFADPQMWESVWAQNTELFPLFSGIIHYCLIKIQHFTFVPVVVMCGRFEICLDSYRLERRWYEWVAIVIHWTWMIFLLSSLPTWREVIIFYLTAAWVEGIFHFQLILSHYCKLFMKVSDFHNTSWYVYQVLSNMNIDVPWWQDWYYGGLNYHIEHHLYPKLARNKLRQASEEVRKVCRRHNIDYDMCYFSTALSKTLSHLKKTGSHFKLDPR